MLDPEFDEGEAVRRLRERGTLGIGDALLDQRALAGIGNVFKSEVCFAERVHPFTPVSALEDDVLLRLVRTARRLLGMNVLESSGGQDGDVHRAAADDSAEGPVGGALGVRTGRHAVPGLR